MRSRSPGMGLAIVLLALTRIAQAQSKPVVIEPDALAKLPDLIGREVEVDDRVAWFQFHPGKDFDQLFLKRAPGLPFEIPERLRKRPPHPPVVKVRGILRRSDGRISCDVTAIEPLPHDLDRFNSGIARLAKTDLETRLAWVRWAEARVAAFRPSKPQDAPDPSDVALLERAREVEAEAIRVESDRPTRDPASHWIALADRARSHQVPEPEPSAQAHRGFRARLSASSRADDLAVLARAIASFFPSSSTPTDAAAPSRWRDLYKKAPADAYRDAPEEVRKFLDHLLWADATQAWLDRRAADDPKGLIALADEAARVLPDRPGVSHDYLEQGLAAGMANIGELRLAEVENLAALYKDRLSQPEKGKELYRAWLDHQRVHALSRRDAQGRLDLADQYESLLGDKPTALALLREADTIDPKSKEVDNAFRQRGFRRVGGVWVEDGAVPSADPAPPDVDATLLASGDATQRPDPDRDPAPARAPRDDGKLRGATPDDVRALFGSPPRRVLVSVQNQILEQWIYRQDKRVLYLNFRHAPGDSRPRVVAYYAISTVRPGRGATN